MTDPYINIPHDIHITKIPTFSKIDIEIFRKNVNAINTYSGYEIECNVEHTINLSVLDSINTKGIYYIFEGTNKNITFGGTSFLYKFGDKMYNNLTIKIPAITKLMMISDPNYKLWHLFIYKEGSTNLISLIDAVETTSPLSPQSTIEPSNSGILTIQDNIGHDIFSGGIDRSVSGSSTLSDSVWNANPNIMKGGFNSEYNITYLNIDKKKPLYNKIISDTAIINGSGDSTKIITESKEMNTVRPTEPGWQLNYNMINHFGYYMNEEIRDGKTYYVAAANAVHFGGQFRKTPQNILNSEHHIGTQEEAILLSGFMPHIDEYYDNSSTSQKVLFYNTALAKLGAFSIQMTKCPNDDIRTTDFCKNEYFKFFENADVIFIAAPDFRTKVHEAGIYNIPFSCTEKGRELIINFIKYQLSLVFEKVLADKSMIISEFNNKANIYLPVLGCGAFNGNPLLYGAIYGEVIKYYLKQFDTESLIITIILTFTKETAVFYKDGFKPVFEDNNTVKNDFNDQPLFNLHNFIKDKSELENNYNLLKNDIITGETYATSKINTGGHLLPNDYLIHIFTGNEVIIKENEFINTLFKDNAYNLQPLNGNKSNMEAFFKELFRDSEVLKAKIVVKPDLSFTTGINITDLTIKNMGFRNLLKNVTTTTSNPEFYNYFKELLRLAQP
jgi:hypothetical protein